MYSEDKQDNSTHKYVSFAPDSDQEGELIWSIENTVNDQPIPIISQVDNSCVPHDTAITARQPSIEDSIEVFWPTGDKYYLGTVTEIIDNGKQVVNYKDGDVEILNISDENRRSCSTLSAKVTSELTLKSNVPDELREMKESIGNTPFLSHRLQGFSLYLLCNSYETEEVDFKNYIMLQLLRFPLTQM